MAGTNYTATITLHAGFGYRNFIEGGEKVPTFSVAGATNVSQNKYKFTGLVYAVFPPARD